MFQEKAYKLKLNHSHSGLKYEFYRYSCSGKKGTLRASDEEKNQQVGTSYMSLLVNYMNDNSQTSSRGIKQPKVEKSP